MTYSPIALFVYNRPAHTQQTLEALKNNFLADKSDLVIFSDAAKSEEDIESVNAVRKYIHEVDGFKSVAIVERDSNFGLAKSIIDGVTLIVNQYGRVIVLEDDLVTSPYFLKFMNDGLNLYHNDERIASIHGYVYPVDSELPQTFFLQGADCWGWSTWKRAWDVFEPDGKYLLAELKKQGLIRKFNMDGAYDYMSMLKGQTIGKNNSWAIRWHASAFLKGYLTLYPGKSLVNNIGHDNSGTHCSTTSEFDVKIFDGAIEINEIDISESADGRQAIIAYMLKYKLTILARIIRKIRRLLGINQ